MYSNKLQLIVWFDMDSIMLEFLVWFDIDSTKLQFWSDLIWIALT